MRGRETLKYLTPNAAPDANLCRTFSVPNDPQWLGALMGAVYVLTQESSWEQFGTVTPAEAAAAFSDIFDVAFYAESECEPMSCCPMRYGGDGVLQQRDPTTGEWTDIEPPPIPARTPVEGQDTRCLAAANATEVYLQTWLAFADLWELGYTVYLLASAIISLLATLLFYPPALPLVLTFFYELYGLMSTIGADDFDSDKQAEFKCILYCASVEVEGVVTFDFNQVLSEVEGRWSAPADYNVWTAINYLLLITGSDGLNRAGTTTAITSADCDCADCGGWCYEFDFTLGQLGWDRQYCGGATEYGTWEGTYWKQAVYGSQRILWLHIPWTPVTGEITRCDFYANRTLGGVTFYAGSCSGGSTIETNEIAPNVSRAALTFDETAGVIHIAIIDSLVASPAEIYKLQFGGTGNCPFGTPNC